MANQFVTFHQFWEDVFHGVHDMSADALKLVFVTALPDESTDAVYADISGTEVSAGGGYSTGGMSLTRSASGHTAGNYRLFVNDYTFTASGNVNDVRAAVVINNTPTSPLKPLIQYIDLLYSMDLTTGQELPFVFDQLNGFLYNLRQN